MGNSGTQGDTAVTDSTAEATITAIIKGILSKVGGMPASLGQKAMAASLPVVLPNNMTDATYIGDIKFGEALPAGSAVIGATQDAGPSWTSSYQFTASADMTGAADLTAAPTAGQKIVIDDIVVSAAVAMFISFLEETSGTEVLRLYLPANGSAQITPRGKLKLPVADKKLRGDASVAGAVAITVTYHSEA